MHLVFNAEKVYTGTYYAGRTVGFILDNQFMTTDTTLKRGGRGKHVAVYIHIGNIQRMYTTFGYLFNNIKPAQVLVLEIIAVFVTILQSDNT